MTKTPETHAQMPDVLADLLRAVRLTGAVFFNARFSAPFGVVSPKRFDVTLPMAHLRHVSIFHLMTTGGCTLEVASGARHALHAGDLVLIPFADEHRLWRGDDPKMTSVEDVVQPAHVRGIWQANVDGGGEETRFICGYLESAEYMSTPLFRTLPEVLVMQAGEGKAGELISSTVREIMTLVDEASPGADIVLGRLMEVLFVEMLRRYASGLPASSKGLLAALNDPVVGRALALIHADPARRWTGESLAREAGASRTVLTERFNALLGRPPIDYVTGWRIQVAAERLRKGNDAVAAIAEDVGYESEASFSRAFKRITGTSPGRWRAGAGESPELMPLQFGKPLGPVPHEPAQA